MLMEQTSNRVNWRDVNVAKAPGQMRLWSYQAVAHGADGVMFFQWRQSRAGAEKFHSAIVPHGPPDHSPTWHEVVRLGKELAGLDAVCGTRVTADVAIVHDWESWWALELPSKPSIRVHHLDQLESYYRHLFDGNLVADFARPSDDLSAYRLVLAPSVYLVSDEAAANLTDYVEAGGTLVMSFFSGIVDPFEHIRLGGYPEPFRRLLGLEVVDWFPLADDEKVKIKFADGAQSQGDVWSELITPAGAEVLARFSGSTLDGHPAVTSHGFGEGRAIYIGTRPERAAMARILGAAINQAGVKPALEAPPGVSTVRRSGPRSSLLFLLNHRDVQVEVPVDDPGVNLVDGTEVYRGLVHLGPRGVAVIRKGW
jgi:beta-galactosidase